MKFHRGFQFPWLKVLQLLWRQFRIWRHYALWGLAIVESFNIHMELLRKLWVLNNPMPNRLHTSFFACLNVTGLYAICLHLKSGWPQEYFVRHGDDSVDKVGVWVTPTLRSWRLYVFFVGRKLHVSLVNGWTLRYGTWLNRFVLFCIP